MIETLAYAGLGLAAEANDKAKAKFNELVEAGKKFDGEGKNYVGDFFKTIDSTKEDFKTQFNQGKEKLEETLPFLKDAEEKFAKTKEDLAAKFKSTKEDLTQKAEEAKEKFTAKAKATAEDVKEKAKQTTEEVKNKVNNITKDAKIVEEAK
jgi:polyhydroxyalkanoate synthesis regulator phasin